MTLSTAAAPTQAELSQEDRARAGFYALIARLFHAGPDAALLAAIAASAVEDNGAELPLPTAWKALVATAAKADAESARLEYDQVFVGTGKAEITPYASHYLAESMQGRVLVRLRETLAELGLARSPGSAEYEDHIAGLCEIMRHLIFFGPDDVAVRKQKSFFLEYLEPWYGDFCAAVVASQISDFYKNVARFTKAFMDVERSSFAMI